MDAVVEVHRAPVGGTYGQITRHARGETLRLHSFPDVELRVADFLR